MPNAIIEKGRLWGTKLTFFRRKEIRVSLLPNNMQSACQFLSSLCLFKKLSIGAEHTPFSLIFQTTPLVQFFVLFRHFFLALPGAENIYNNNKQLRS